MVLIQQKRLYFCCCRLLSRFAHSDVRVRFAPSPTGQLHLGGLRTALYNYLFAKSQNGKFVLRIEDTDQTRLVPGATENLIADLRWLGIEIDEGPTAAVTTTTTATTETYVQSARLHLYQNAVKTLLNNGSAYYCFCTDRRLDLLRKQALRASQVPRYDNKCRHLSGSALQKHFEQRTMHCIRFKLQSQLQQPFDDLIYGAVQHNVADTEGDPVIIKTDGFPTYHFANVVDDHLMRITHVLRGVEWQISTPKHLLLYQAFGWQPPKFGHLPLLVNADGSKLSKRQGDIGVQQFRDNGYFPAAVLNYVISAGGGFSRSCNQKQQIYSLAELVTQFDLKRINTHSSRLNPQLLDDFNRLEISRQLQNAESSRQLVQQVQQMLQEKYAKQAHCLDLQAEHIEQILKWSAQRITCLQDLCSEQLSFLWLKTSDFVVSNMNTQQWQRLLQIIEETSDFNKQQLNANLKSFAKTEQLAFVQVMKTLRSALSGLKQGPAVAEIMQILGKQVVLQRLNNCVVSSQEDVAKDMKKLEI